MNVYIKQEQIHRLGSKLAVTKGEGDGSGTKQISNKDICIA